MPRQPREMTVSEAGRKGGQTVRERYGLEFYEEIGRKGGRIGGQVVKRRYGSEFYEEIGRKGGQAVKRLIEQGKQAGGK
jgi:general stress protein YciG